MTRAKRQWGIVRLRFVAEARAIFVREWRTEWRTRVALSGTALFTLCALTLIGLSLNIGGTVSASAALDAGLLWIVILFTAAIGLGRAFVQEEERGTILALRLTGRATAVWTGKFLANASLLIGLSVLATPALAGIMSLGISNPALLICVLVLGDIGVAAVFTTTGALVAQTTARGGLLAALSFPLLVPLLIGTVLGTQKAFGVGAEPGQTVAFGSAGGELKILASYAVVAITASLLLFDFIWSD